MMARPAKRTGKTVPGFTEAFGERLQSVISRIGKLEHVSEVSGISGDKLNAWKFGRSRPDFFALQRLCDIADRPIAWLATGEGFDSADVPSQTRTEPEHQEVPVLHVSADQFVSADAFVSVPVLDVRASAGSGEIAVSETVSSYLAFEAAYLRSLGITPTFARILEVAGDSMIPTLADSDRIVIDTSIDHIVDEGLYAVVFGSAVLVKRVQIRLDGTIVLRSDNRSASYEDVVVPPADQGDLRVVGRVKIRIHLM